MCKLRKGILKTAEKNSSKNFIYSQQVIQMHSKLFTPPAFKLHDIFHFHHILIVTKHYYYNTMLLLSRAGPGRAGKFRPVQDSIRCS